MWDHLPSDILVRIISTLSVKDVIRCSVLQKSCYSIVHSKLFIDAYNKEARMDGKNPPLIFIRYRDLKMKQGKWSLRYDSAGLEECTPLSFPFEEYTVGSCCNGLVCLFHYDHPVRNTRFILWNPHIRKFLRLPLPNFHLNFETFVGLGFVEETSDYKIIMANGLHQVELYSLQHNSWKIIANLAPEIVPLRISYYETQYVCVKGSLYWITLISEMSVVGVFDFKDEVFSMIYLPYSWESISPSRLVLRAHGESSIAIAEDLYYPKPQPGYLDILVMDVNVNENEKQWYRYSTLGAPLTGRTIGRTIVLGFNKEEEEICECEVYENETAKRWTIRMRHDGEYMNVMQDVHINFISNYVSNLTLLDIAEAGESSAPNYSSEAKRRKCVEDVHNC